MAQPTAQPTPTWIPPLAARALVMRWLSSSPLAEAERLLLKWVEAGKVQWRYGHIENGSGVSKEIALNRFWRPVGLSFSWEEGRAGRRVEPRMAARGGVTPEGIVWASHPTRATQPQRGNDVVLSDIKFAREDIEFRLREYGAPEPAPSSASTTERHADPQDDQKRAHPQGDRVMIVLRAEFPPDGTVPPPSELSDSDLVARVSQRFSAPKKSGDPLIPGRKSILRAAGRLPRK